MVRTMVTMALLIAGCDGGGDTDEGMTDQEIGEQIGQEIEGWEDWTTIEPWDGIQPSSDCTHGAYVEITFNDLAAQAYGSDDLPDGSLIVKRGYDAPDGSEPRGFVTVMKKIDGYDPDTNDWFWLRIADDGTLSDDAIGKATFCSSCHAAGGTDYLLTTRDEPGEPGACE